MAPQTYPFIERVSLVERLIDLDKGNLDEQQTIELFQHLVDTGLAWQLQGRIGRQAVDLIEAGLVTPCRA